MKQRWLLPALTGHCAIHRGRLASRSASAALEADCLRPGSDANADLSEFGWAIYFVALRMHIEQLDAETKHTAREAASSLARLLEILCDAPLAVDCLDNVRVYPKSMHSLAFTVWCGEKVKEIRSEPAEFQGAWANEAVTHFCQMIAWASVHPGPTLPFAEYLCQVPPQEFRQLSPEGSCRISGALATLHVDRVAFLESLTSPERLATGPDGTAGSYGMDSLISDLSAELDVSEESLRRDRSMLSLRALAVVTSELYVAPPPSVGGIS